MFINGPEAGLANIAGRQRQISAAPYFAHGTDKGETLAGQTAPAALGAARLPAQALVLGGAGGLEVDGQAAFPFFQFSEGFFIGLGRQGPFHIFSPSHRHQKENVMGRRAQFDAQVGQGFGLVKIPGRQGAVDLKRQAHLQEVGRRFPQPFESPVKAPEGIVAGRVRPVQAQADPGQAALPHGPGQAGVHQGAVGGQEHAQAQGLAVGGQVQNVGPHQRFPAA